MAVNVIDQIQPKNAGAFPVMQDAFLQGGWRVVSGLAERNAIPEQRRKVGMRCKTITPDTTWALVGGITNGHWFEVAEGGAVTGKMDQTTELLRMTVDPVAGVSPALGTLVHSQAEYDALGAPLLYPQDVFDILPIGLKASVFVSVEDGVCLAKPNDSGFPGYSFLGLPKAFKTVADRFFTTDHPYYNNPIISFEGKNRTVIRTCTGHCNGRGSIGTILPAGMTPDEYRYKMVYITSGANAGTMFPIRTNGADYINGPAMYLEVGDCEFEIYDIPAKMIPSTDGINQDAGGLYWQTGIEVSVFFVNIDFGTEDVAWNSIEDYQRDPWNNLWIMDCRFIFGLSYMSLYINHGAHLNVQNSLLDFRGGHGVEADGIGSWMWVANCILKGVPNAAFMIPYGGAIIGQYGNVFQDMGTFAGPLIFCQAGGLHNSGESWAFGNDLATAIKVQGSTWFEGIPSVVGYYMWCENVEALIELRATEPGFTFGAHYTFVHSGTSINYGWKIICANVETTEFKIPNDYISTQIADMQIDGLNYSYAEIGNAPGTEIHGQYGSKIKKITGI